MKKVLALIFTCCVIVGVFTACSSKSDKGNTTSPTAPASTVTTIPTKQAKVNDSDAISLIQSYSRKELGLTKDEYDKCTFMVNSSGKTVSGKKGYYILVTAGIKKSAGKNDKGQQLTTIDAVGNYYISFDGKEILREVIDKNGNASYKNMDVKKVPTSKTANHVHEDETTKK